MIGPKFLALFKHFDSELRLNSMLDMRMRYVIRVGGSKAHLRTCQSVHAFAVVVSAAALGRWYPQQLA